MKVRKYIVIFVAVTLLGLVGCSSNDEATDEKNNSGKANTKSETTKEDNDQNKSETEDLYGIEIKPTYNKEKLNQSGQIDSIKYKITDIQVSKGKVSDEARAKELEVVKDKELTVVTLFAVFENKTDRIVTYNPSSSTLVANTDGGETEKADFAHLIDEKLDEDYVAKDKKEGSFFFILKNTNVEDLKSVDLSLDVPVKSYVDQPVISINTK
ncbi:hypothetical protein [Metaclostridioides mangenotii]|uniref:hypothetical protein n=1 Tax=Metaclostridioides mangenotii TaxID=1540 RepID=UPI0026F2CC3D|nr:hypothetical protein [Clostridioides mangenotii]